MILAYTSFVFRQYWVRNWRDHSAGSLFGAIHTPAKDLPNSMDRAIYCRFLPRACLIVSMKVSAKTAPRPDRWKEESLLAQLLAELARVEGFVPTSLPDVRLMHSRETHPRAPVAYDSSIVIIAQGRKRGWLGGRSFTYDARNYLVLSVPLPFECETMGTLEEPMLGLSIRVNPVTIAELLLELDNHLTATPGLIHAIDATPLTPEMSDAAVRLARCLLSPADARVLGPQIVREITYRALGGGQGAALRELASPQSGFGRVARALRRMHLDYAQALEVNSLAREAGMSVSTFHANFKAVTAKPPLRYLQTVRLHKAQALMVAGTPVAEAARRVGYESPSQFSREFKRLFGGTPKEVANRSWSTLFTF
jgi:AraC-like DNA-binding protein